MQKVRKMNAHALSSTRARESLSCHMIVMGAINCVAFHQLVERAGCTCVRRGGDGGRSMVIGCLCGVVDSRSRCCF